MAPGMGWHGWPLTAGHVASCPMGNLVVCGKVPNGNVDTLETFPMGRFPLWLNVAEKCYRKVLGGIRSGQRDNCWPFRSGKVLRAALHLSRSSTRRRASQARCLFRHLESADADCNSPLNRPRPTRSKSDHSRSTCLALQ